MINKLLPRKLSSDLDSKIRAKDDMFDALNITISDDDREGGVTGNGGALKPIKSNTLIVPEESLFNGDANKVVLGKVADNKNDVLYLFVWSSEPNEQGVYAYDPMGFFPDHPSEELIKIHTNAEYGFTQDGFVKGDVTYTQKKSVYNGVKYEDSPMLFFTDNIKEPKKLSVLRAMYDESVLAYAAGSPEIRDFIFACPKAPVTPIEFSFSSDESLLISEFRGVNGFQFAYQGVYKDGNETAISTYSSVAVPPSYINQGTGSSANLLQHNVCDLVVPSEDLSDEVEKVKILSRRGEDGSWGVIYEDDYLGVDISFAFKNNNIDTASPKEDQIKYYDNLPKRAEAQTIIGDRLVYGNYLEGFDPVSTEATITPIPQQRPADFVTYNLRILPATCKSPSDTNNKNVAFVIETSQLPQGSDGNGIVAGDVVKASFSFAPNNNWHIYNSEGSYHQHSQLGDYYGAEGYNSNTENNHHQYWQDDDASGASFLSNQFQNDFAAPAVCNTLGVGGDKYWSADGSASYCGYGTSAGNPLIISGGEISFAIGLKVKENFVGAVSRSLIAEAISQLVTNGELTPPSPDLLISETFASFDVLEEETSIQSDYSVDLGLDSGDTFNQTNPKARLITMLGLSSSGAYVNQDVNGAFIVNKANISFSLFEDQDYISSGEGLSDDRRIGIYIDSISAVETLTCVRRAVTNSPWVVFDENGLSSVDIDSEDDIPSGPNSYQLTPLVHPDTALRSLSSIGDDFLEAVDGSGVSKFSLMDGAGGPAGGPATSGGNPDYDNETVILEAYSGFTGAWGYGSAALKGTLSESTPLTGAFVNNNIKLSAEVMTLPLINNGTSNANPPNFVHPTDGDMVSLPLLEVTNISFFVEQESEGNRSFKSSTSHDFGVVYYDNRGRSSVVQPLGSAFAPSYYDREEGNEGNRSKPRFD